MKNAFRLCRLSFILVALICCYFGANVQAASYALTVDTSGSGTVSRNPTNSSYPEGSVVILTAAPGQGWFFREWTGDETGSANPLNVTMTRNKTVTAVFAAIPAYTLTTSASGMGTVTADPASGPYLSNSVVSLSATGNAGWVFSHWTGSASGAANPLLLKMDNNKTVQAVFGQIPVIDGAPQDVNADAGATVSFTSHAIGSEPLYYQWWFGGLKLENATNATLSLTNVQSAQEGAYSVVVSNVYGADTRQASLAINSSCTGTNVVTEASEGALRQAIAIGGNVRLCFNGTITLSQTIQVTRDVALDAIGRSVVLSGGDSVRLFEVGQGISFSATNVNFVDGRHVGDKTLGLPGQGGAILGMGGSVQLISCTLSNNSAQGPDGVRADGRGGAVAMVGGSLLLQSATLMNNSAAGGWAGDALGGAVYATNTTVLIENCTLGSNICYAPPASVHSSSRGGALCLESASTIISQTLLATNRAFGGAAPNTLENVLVPSAAYGGAILAKSGTLNLLHCSVFSNLAIGGNGFRHSGTGEAEGGALYSSASLLVKDTAFSGNRAQSGNGSSKNTSGAGGAVHNSGSAVFERCAFVANSVEGGASGSFGSPDAYWQAGHGYGGAIYNGAQLALTNCTLTLNIARGGNDPYPWSELNGSGFGGGIYNTNGVVSAMNVTIAGNFVAIGYGTNINARANGANIANTNGTLALANSILAYPDTNNNAWGTITDNGFNISSDGSANFNSGASFNYTDPRLYPLGNNGGPTPTLALQTNSPAVNSGTATGAPAVDQRGLNRPALGAFDIGAYELQSTTRAALKLNPVVGGLRLSFVAQPGVLYVLRGSSSLTGWTNLETFGPFTEESLIERQINTGSAAQFFQLELR
jgi:hypothetical protein